MANLRNLGYKINILFNNSSTRKQEFCKQMNFSQTDLDRLLFGRLALNPSQIAAVADFFSITQEELVSYKNTDFYKNMTHCMSPFSSQEHCDEILNIIDTYIDIKEAL